MSESSSTSTPGTENLTAAVLRLSRKHPQTRVRMESRFAYTPVALGSPSTPTSTDPDCAADIPTIDECDFEMIMAGGERHPVAVVCLTHGWSGSING